MGKAAQRTLRFELAVDDVLVEYCRRTSRQPADVIRAAVKLFLADGFESAERRLASALWNAPPVGKSKLAHDLSDLTPEERTAWIVDGELPERYKPKPKRG